MMKLPQFDLPWWGKLIVVLISVSGTLGFHLTRGINEFNTHQDKQITSATKTLEKKIYKELDQRKAIRDIELQKSKSEVSLELKGMNQRIDVAISLMRSFVEHKAALEKRSNHEFTMNKGIRNERL